ncbi:MAG: ATP-binding protein [Chloroflexi bacterium]|nr:ATP-binding protein [Chloroflexota bacterium]
MDETGMTSNARQIVKQQVESGRDELASLYRKDIQELLFTNRSGIRPRMVAQIAEQEVDAFLRALTDSSESVQEHGIWLSQLGVSHQTLLRLGKSTRQFVIAHTDHDLLLDALSIVEQYEEAVALGFAQNHEEIILAEQERIRGALQLAVGRYTVEITEVKKIADQATEANEFKTKFIARISHELRTPLGALMGMSEMLQEGVYGPLNDLQKNLVSRILNNATTLSHIFSELLDQSQIESGQLRLKKEKFSPNAVVESVYSNYLSMALKKGISLHKELTNRVPQTVIGDQARTEQILSNLVVNAIKFTNTGRVNIRIDGQGEANWVLRVEDTGAGISEEDMQMIFEPFRQADETTSRRYGGVGLGLSIVLLLVKAMNGAIRVDSKLGQGSTFTVTLPVQPTQA